MEQSSQSPQAKPAASCDECIELLAGAVDQHDEAHLDDVASLIGQLAVVIEL